MSPWTLGLAVTGVGSVFGWYHIITEGAGVNLTVAATGVLCSVLFIATAVALSED